jgi:hypothetical protein
MQLKGEHPATAAAARGVPKNDLAGAWIASQSKSSQSEIQYRRAKFAQALTRSVFDRNYVVVHESVAKPSRFARPSRIHSWRAAR